MFRTFVVLTLGILVIGVPVDAQEKPSAKQFERMVRSSKELLIARAAK